MEVDPILGTHQFRGNFAEHDRLRHPIFLIRYQR